MIDRVEQGIVGVNRRRAVAWLIAGAGVVGAAVAVILIVVSGTDDPAASGGTSMTGTPPSDAPPEPNRETANSTLAFLDGEGAVLLAVHDAAREIARGADRERCAQVADRLDRDAPRDEVTLLIAEVTDEPLQAALTDEHNSLGAMLAACAEGSTVIDDRLTPLDEISRLVQERIEALRAAR